MKNRKEKKDIDYKPYKSLFPLELRENKFKKWTKDENKVYAQQLLRLQEIIEKKSERYSKKVFVLMSGQISSKNSNQCRTHHQKMLKKFKTVDKIISNLLSQPANTEINSWKQEEQFEESQIKLIDSHKSKKQTNILKQKACPLPNYMKIKQSNHNQLQYKITAINQIHVFLRMQEIDQF